MHRSIMLSAAPILVAMVSSGIMRTHIDFSKQSVQATDKLITKESYQIHLLVLLHLKLEFYF